MWACPSIHWWWNTVAEVIDKVLNIPINLPCDPHLRAEVGGGKRLKWAFKRLLSSASGRAPRSNRNQHSSKSKRKQIRHLLRVSREVVGASPARRRPCGTARTWWIDYSFHPGLDHLVKKKDSGGFLKLPPQWPRPVLDILWYFIAGQDGGWLKNWFPKTSNCVQVLCKQPFARVQRGSAASTTCLQRSEAQLAL